MGHSGRYVLYKNLRKARRERRTRGLRRAENRFVLTRLLTPPIRRRTVICTLIAAGSLISFWSVSTWTPQIIRELATEDGLTGGAIDHRVSVALMLFNAGGIMGYASWGFVADWVGRRSAFTISFMTGGVSIFCLYPFAHSYAVYLWVLPVVGFGLFGALSGNFVYFPEVFGPSMRATGIALANSVGRYLTAVGPLAVGVTSTAWFAGDLGLAATVTSCIGLVGLIGVALTPETRGRALPSE
ncbi:MFS transporter [Actinomadura sp. HBU206391]|uniref:MFS transporter n=1 Tax=Actinomadura sp. HBU206391 TaxID=2731692 RepID=UPI00164FCF4C|nr:MFS transporter [Actinomadura sp. HBU206391]MBC6462960.1 MFS transporter [Actinomadura sp. HBU206391]